MPKFLLKTKTKHGQRIVDNAKETNTITELKELISGLENIPVNSMCLLTGYPPKPVISDSQFLTLADVNIKSGDTLIVDETPQKVLSTEKNQETVTTIVKEKKMSSGLLMRHIVDSDNSCLFTCVQYVLGEIFDITDRSDLRRIIAEQVAADPIEFSEAILGKPNNEYCEWIKKPETWGGAIELAILSKYFEVEIDVVDTINCVINCFGEDRKYPLRVFLIFDGIHYDALYRESSEPGGSNQTLFPSSEDEVYKLAKELAYEAKASKQFTDLNKFTLRCLVCRREITGQTEAQKHAKETGHQNFGEISS